MLEVVPECIIRFLVEGLDDVIGLPEVLTHTDSLCFLFWEDTDNASCHSVILLSTRLESGHTGGGGSIVPRFVVLIRPFNLKRHMVADVTPDFPPPCGPGFLDVAVAFNVFLNTLTYPLFHEALRHVNGILNRFGGGAPVANNAGAVDPEEWRTTVFGSIDALSDIVQRRTHQDRGQAAPRGIGEAGLQGLAIHLRKPFAHLQGNVPNKAITHDDIGDATKKMLPFNIPDEIEMTLLQHEEGFFGDIVALGVFFPNCQQPHGGRRLAKYILGKHMPHDTKLEELGGFAIDVRSDIEEDRKPCLGR